MDPGQGSPAAESQVKTFTPQDRIAELNDIDKSVASLLTCAGQAIKLLANTSSTAEGPATLDAQKAAFTHHSASYFSNLSSIEVRLRRQVYALEEAGLIGTGDERDAKRGRAAGGDERAVVAGGPLDVSWLNARARDTVGKNMEKELWTQAKEYIEAVQEEEKSAAEEVKHSEQDVMSDDT